jgi:N-acetylneuraminic acid mutarotase
MFRPALALALGTLALAACGEDSTPTQPGPGVEPVPAAPLAAAFVPNTWTLKAVAPGFVNQTSAGEVPDSNGQSIVFLLGGRDEDGGNSAPIRRYRIGTNTWFVKSLQPQLSMFASNGVGRIGQTLYVSGGESYSGGSHHFDARFWAYDPATNILTQKPTPPKSTSRGVTGVISGRLYVLPGLCDTEVDPPSGCTDRNYRRLLRFTPGTNSWTYRKTAPHFHTEGAGGVIAGKFYVAGGQDSLVEHGTSLDRYDPATDTWQTLAPIPEAGFVRGSTIQGKLFVVVTTYPNGLPARRAYSYDPATNSWTRKAAPHYDHADYVAITWGSGHFLLGVGGIRFDPSPENNPTEVYAP